MPFEIHLDEPRKLVRVVATGVFHRTDGEEMITAARLTAAKHKFDLLYDVRATKTRVPFAEWFLLPRDLGVLSSPSTRFVHVAIIAPRGGEEDGLRFYETVTGNLGLRVRIFLDEESAIEWLEAER